VKAKVDHWLAPVPQQTPVVRLSDPLTLKERLQVFLARLRRTSTVIINANPKTEWAAPHLDFATVANISVHSLGVMTKPK
jgi:hypothetical protein